MNRRLPTPSFRMTLALLLAGLTVAAQGGELPSSSPFLPPTGRAAGAQAVSTYQLGGMMRQGADLMVSITRMSDRHSFWIPVGGTVNEVTVLSCNADREEVTIRAGGEQLTLTLRRAIVQEGGNSVPLPVSEGSAVATAPLPPPVGPPEVQEREARMLVTDLLDIGQQHRKAYEEAKRKADAKKKP